MADKKRGIGSHHSKSSNTNEWLTPPWLLEKLGSFDLDPCAPINRLWATAKKHYTIEDNGLALPWSGRVWLNPPYSDADIWLEKLRRHGNGVALIFARTETSMFFQHVWGAADGLLFLKGRVVFYYPDGTIAPGNSGAPSVLVAYGADNVNYLYRSNIEGAFILGYEIVTKQSLGLSMEEK